MLPRRRPPSAAIDVTPSQLHHGIGEDLDDLPARGLLRLVRVRPPAAAVAAAAPADEEAD